MNDEGSGGGRSGGGGGLIVPSFNDRDSKTFGECGTKSRKPSKSLSHFSGVGTFEGEFCCRAEDTSC